MNASIMLIRCGRLLRLILVMLPVLAVGMTRAGSNSASSTSQGSVQLPLQEPLDLKQAAVAPVGSGRQKRPGGQAIAKEHYLHLVFRVAEGGKADIVSASEHPGRVVLSEYMSSSYVYEVRRGARMLATESVPDPFERRSFPGPPESKVKGHHVTRTTSGEIVVRVPAVGLADRSLDGLTVRLLRVRPKEPMLKLDPTAMAALVKHGLVEVIAQASGLSLSEQIRKVGRKVGE